MLGYYSLLEEQVTRGSVLGQEATGSTVLNTDDDAQAYHHLDMKQASVWEMWADRFVSR